MKNLFVPSKKRYNSSKLLNLATKYNIYLNVVVEPQDYENYKQFYPNFNYIILPINDGGITYVRNFIKSYAEQNQIPYYWQLDDDISSFYYREGTKLISSNFDVLLKAQNQFIKNEIALGALEYRQFAWSANKDIIENSFCDTCVFVDNTKLKNLKYNNYVEGKEDRDFAMQVIKNNFKTGRTTLFAFSSPPNGSNTGGLKEIFYDLGKEEICVARMIEIWGENICNIVIKPNGRKDVKINWNKINTSQILLF